MNRQTFHAKNREVPQAWWTVDASEHRLGRLATRIATVLMGKHKPEYTPHHDVGDFIIVTNAEQIQLTGNKLDDKVHATFSGHPGGHKTKTYRWLRDKQPELMIELAVKRMLPKTKMGAAMLKKLKVYRGGEHPHQAQSPQPLPIQSAN